MQTASVARNVYSVGIICALAKKKAAVRAMLDEEHPRLAPAAGDENDYTFGKIGEHGVAIACLPGDMGTTSASAVAVHMRRSFPIKIGLMVGICGGVWSEDQDIRLGDVVVSKPTGQHGGVVQWDFGKVEDGGGFCREGTLNKPPRPLRSAVTGLEAQHLMTGHNLQKHLDEMILKFPSMAKTYGRQADDQLFEASYSHVTGNSTCAQCDLDRVQHRPARDIKQPEIHYGNIASGNAVIKDGPTRDRIARQEEVLCFEMEAAGLRDTFPCMVIRGVCDYADSHKNKQWQSYAAAVAAAYARELLLWMPAADVATIRSASETTQPSKGVIHIPFLKNHQFVGRRAELEVLYRRMITVQDCQRLAVEGLGGMGKTQLVLSFAHSVVEKHPDMSVFWIPALSAETFERGAEKIAQQLGIRSAANQSEDAKELVKQHLSTPSAGRWLLIVDNADDIDIFEASTRSKGLLQYLPESRLGVSIFTTRTSSVAQRIAGSDVLRLQKPTRDEAAELLERVLVVKDSLKDPTAVTNFLTELEHLPLAITQAAAYININHTSIAEYSRLLRSTDEDVVYLMSAEIRDNTRYEASSSAIATTWVVSFKQIMARDTVAADLLQYISCIEWKGIPRSILPTVRPEARTLNAVGTLCSYSFLSKRADGETYDMHRLVHLASRIWLREGGRTKKTQTHAMVHLATIFPIDAYTNREIWRAFLPHVTRIRTDWASADAEAGVQVEYQSKLSLQVGRCLLVDGRTTEALHWLEESFQFRASLAEDHPDRLASQYELSRAYQANGQTKDAIRLLERVGAILKTALAEDHQDRLASQHELARAYQANGQTKDAIRLLERVGAILKTSLAEDHPNRLALQHTLARAYQANGQTKDATRLLERVVAIHKTSLVEDHPDRLTSQFALARAYQANGQMKDAIRLLELVVATEETSLAEDHPDRLASQHELSRAYQANGQTKDAIRLLELVVATEETSLAEDHPDRLASQHELSRAYQANGQMKDAIRLLELVVATEETSLAEDHPDRLASQHELAIAYQANGQMKDAIQLLERVVAILKTSPVENHPNRLAWQHSLAIAYHANGQTKDAIQLLERVVAILKTSPVENHPNRLAWQHSLAIAYHANGQTKDAIQLLERVVAILKTSPVENHPNRLAWQHSLAIAYHANGQTKDAIRLLRGGKKS